MWFGCGAELSSARMPKWQKNYPHPAPLQAPAFPPLTVVLSDGSSSKFPPVPPAGGTSSSSPPAAAGAAQPAGIVLQPADAALVCLAFRAGAQPILEAWARPFSERFAGRPGVVLYELAVVEGLVRMRTGQRCGKRSKRLQAADPSTGLASVL